jgi:O-antigen/teichoic acid export membrane protein
MRNRLKAVFQTIRLKAVLRTVLRTDRRLLRAGLTGVVTLIARGVTVLVGLATLPLTSHYLGKERFGLWLMLSSFVTWFAIADLGLTNSLINALSTADGKDDRRQAREAVSSAFWMVAAIAAVMILLCLIVAPLLDWAMVFNIVSPQAAAEITPAVLVVLVFCALRLPASIIGSVYQAYQEGYVYQVWNGLSGLLGAAGLVIAIYLQAGLPWLVAAFLGSMLLADLLSAIHLFGWRREWLLPSLRHFAWPQARWLLTRGAQFWIAQVSSVLMLQTDLIIVARMFGPGAVAGYGTTLRLFALIGAAQAAFVAPLWAAYGEASARGDAGWLSQTFKRSVRVSLWWSIPAAILMFVAMPVLFTWLVKADVTSDWRLSLAVMTTEIINSVARCVSTLLNGLGAVRSQAIFGPVGGVVNLLLSWALGLWLGAPGVAWATAICLVVFWLGIMGRDAALRLREVKLGAARYAG